MFTGKSLDRIMALKARAGDRDLYDVMNKEKKNRDTETGSTRKASKNVFDFINKKLGRKKGKSSLTRCLSVGSIRIVLLVNRVCTFSIRIVLLVNRYLHLERGSSAVECRTRNQVSPGSNPLCYRFEDWAFSFSPLTPRLTQLYK